MKVQSAVDSEIGSFNVTSQRDTKMKLEKMALFTDGVFPYVIGGMQKHSYYLAKYLARKGVQVQLYHFPGNGEQDIHSLSAFTPEEKKFITSIVLNFPVRNSFPGHYLRASYEYSRMIFEHFTNNRDVDFVYAKGFTGWKLLEEKGKGFQCPPIGVNFHGYEMFQKSNGLKSKLEQIFLLRNAVLRNMERSDFLFSYGGRISELILRQGFSHKKIIEVPAGIERSWISNPPDELHPKVKFVFLGRIEKRKGMDELIKAIHLLKGSGNFEFHFIGPVPENKKIVSAEIFYHGQFSDPVKIKDILKSCDVLVCPSRSEGMPNVILEGMACGLAIISSDVGAVNLMVNADNGWLLKNGSAEEIAETMEMAIDEKETLLNKMKKKSVEKAAASFLWDDIILQTINGIEKAVLKSSQV